MRGQVLLKVKGSVGCNRPDSGQDDTQTRTDTRTRKTTLRACHEGNTCLEMRLLLHHGCHDVQNLEDRVIHTCSSRQHSQNEEKFNRTLCYTVFPSDGVFMDPWMAHTLTHKWKGSPCLSRREKHEARLLLYRGCVKVYSVRAGLLLVAGTGTQQQSEKQCTRYILYVFLVATVCFLECSTRSCPTHMASHKGRNFECSQTDGGRHYGPCLAGGVQRDSVGSMGRARVVQLLQMQQTQSYMGYSSIRSPCKDL